MQKLLTGLQPSGALHIGNYFGALKPFVELAYEYESTLMIADYHALTSLRITLPLALTRRSPLFSSNPMCPNTRNSHGFFSVL